MSEELLNCPFCDSNTITVTHIHNVRWGCYCDDCDTQQDPNAATYEEAIKAWNTRANTVTDKEHEEALEWLTLNAGFSLDDEATAGSHLSTIRKALSRPKHTPMQAKMLRHALMSAKCSFHTDEERDAINELLKECK